MFLKFGGIGFPPRRRAREECGAGIFLAEKGYPEIIL